MKVTKGNSKNAFKVKNKITTKYQNCYRIKLILSLLTRLVVILPLSAKKTRLQFWSMN